MTQESKQAGEVTLVHGYGPSLKRPHSHHYIEMSLCGLNAKQRRKYSDSMTVYGEADRALGWLSLGMVVPRDGAMKEEPHIEEERRLWAAAIALSQLRGDDIVVCDATGQPSEEGLEDVVGPQEDISSFFEEEHEWHYEQRDWTRLSLCGVGNKYALCTLDVAKVTCVDCRQKLAQQAIDRMTSSERPEREEPPSVD